MVRQLWLSLQVKALLAAAAVAPVAGLAAVWLRKLLRLVVREGDSPGVAYDANAGLWDNQWLTSRMTELLADCLADGCGEELATEVAALVEMTIETETGWLALGADSDDMSPE